MKQQNESLKKTEGIKEELNIKKSKTGEFVILEKEDSSFIINVDGWRIRVRFSKHIKKEVQSKYNEGLSVELKYFGNIEDVHSLKFIEIT